MTSPETSEAEVEAARAALRDQFDIWMAPISMRAALTAAAQVRAQAAKVEITQGAREMVEKLIEAIGQVKSRYSSGFDPEGQRRASEFAAEAIANARLFVPAALGIRKGE